MTFVLSIVAGFMFSYGFYGVGAFAIGGELWGIKIQASPAQERFAKTSKVFMIIGIIGTIGLIVPNFLLAIKMLFETPIIILLFIVAWVISIVAGTIFAKKKGSSPELGEKNNNLLVLGELEYIKAVENQLDEAKYFYIDREGIALINAQHYCYAVEKYECYRLGALSNDKQVALVAGYFEQKYKGVFDYKSQFERIMPTPGKTITLFGTGGVAFAHEPGTKYQANFQGILATRK